MTTPVEKHEASLAQTPGLNVVENVHLEPPMRLPGVVPTSALILAAKKEKEKPTLF